MPSAMTDLPRVHGFDPTSQGYLTDPYTSLRRLRTETPVCLQEESGLAFLLRFEDVGAGLTEITRNPEGERRMHFPANPFATDGPAHTRPRRVIAPEFTAARSSGSAIARSRSSTVRWRASPAGASCGWWRRSVSRCRTT